MDPAEGKKRYLEVHTWCGQMRYAFAIVLLPSIVSTYMYSACSVHAVHRPQQASTRSRKKETWFLFRISRHREIMNNHMRMRSIVHTIKLDL